MDLGDQVRNSFLFSMQRKLSNMRKLRLWDFFSVFLTQANGTVRTRIQILSL